MKIVIITMHAARNYGAVLQTYALQKYLEERGAKVEIIDYRRDNQKLVGYLFNVNAKFRSSKLKSLLFIIKTFIPKLFTSRLFSKFLQRKIHLSTPVKHGDLIVDTVKADVYCTGSDQVWNPLANNGFNRMYFLEGAYPKVSYAASIGIHSMEKQYQEEMSELLKDYCAISVREQSSISILEKLGMKGECVLDPTLLLTSDDWDKFATVGNIIPSKYLLVYYFGNTAVIMQMAQKIACEKSLRIVRVSVGFESYREDDIVLRFMTPEKFVGLFSKASFVLTNSFHGTAFSINYSVDFLVYPTTEHNARFDSILDMFDLQSRNLRLISDPLTSAQCRIDWDSVQKELNSRRKSSYRFIANNLMQQI